MLKNFRRVSWGVALLVILFLTGLIGQGIYARQLLDRVKVKGPIYTQIKDMDDVRADILPPPAYLVESYLKVLQLEGETNPARIQQLIRELRELKSGPDQYDARQAYWQGRLAAGPLKDALTQGSREPAQEFWSTVEGQLFPAAQAGDRARVRALARGPLARLYEQHRKAIVETVRLSEQEKNRIESFADQTVSRSLAGLIAGVTGVSIAGIVLSFLIASLITGGLKRAVEQIRRVTQEFASSIDEQERMAAQQAAAVNQTTTTMAELGASARLSSEQADAAAGGARQALSLADEGGQTVDQTLHSMGGLKDRSNAIAQQILRLSEHTNQIGNITNLVSDLANQTNLLALNAAVEAARAGEHGKGFAVVAAEIRKLADQSKRSAERINGLVSEIQQATNSTVMVTEEGTKNVEQGTGLAQRTGEAFNELAVSIGSAFESVQQIALNARQQAGAVNQVVEAMTSLNSGAREAAAAVSQTKVGVSRLEQAARDLQSLV